MHGLDRALDLRGHGVLAGEVDVDLAAFGIGQFVLGDGHVAFTQPPAFALTFDYHDIISWAHAVWDWAYDLGKPLVIGLVLLASALAMIGYFGVKLVWRWYLIRAWRRRSAKR